MVIFFNAKSTSMNSATISSEIFSEYLFYKPTKSIFDKNENDIEVGTFGLSNNGGLFNLFNKERKIKVNFIYEFLRERTFEQRFEKYLYFLNRDGYFIHYDIIFYNNGDIFEDGVFQGNIKTAASQNKLIHGQLYGGHANKTYDPYAFEIIKDSKNFGFQHDVFRLQNMLNKDIFDILVSNCLKSGNMI